MIELMYLAALYFNVLKPIYTVWEKKLICCLKKKTGFYIATVLTTKLNILNNIWKIFTWKSCTANNYLDV